jgi:nucleotide sugar dehydrogenase
MFIESLSDDARLSGVTTAVYGLGKMGLPLAAVLADHGASVHGVDIDPDVVAAVNKGDCPVRGEPGLPELLEEYGGAELTATTDGVAAAEAAEFVVVLVPTVVDEDREPVLGPVLNAAETIGRGLSGGELVVLESTAPPGTTVGPFTEAVAPPSLEAGVDFGVAHCPERTSSGRVIEDLTRSYPKIVGGISEASTGAAARVYRRFNEPGVIEMGSATEAEAVKLFEGVYRDVNIALANELALACEEWGLDARTVFEAANTQPYCDIHDPGVGVGGHCIPVYPHFVVNRASETPLLQTARDVNDGMPGYTANLTTAALEAMDVDPQNANALVLGVTYRPGVNETRFAPALDLIPALSEAGVRVHAHDPLLGADRLESFGAVPVESVHDIANLDAAILVTGHEEYAELDLSRLAAGMRTALLVDGRDFFDHEAVAAAGLRRITVGDGTDDRSQA